MLLLRELTNYLVSVCDKPNLKLGGKNRKIAYTKRKHDKPTKSNTE